MSQEVKSILDAHPSYEAVIGIEVHVQLKTKSKVYCSCSNQFGVEPNTNICPICTGQPGVLPVLNKKVVDYALMAALATKSTVNRVCDFARKHYMYPDTPKNYQITQDQRPICVNGAIPIQTDDGKDKVVRLVRIHMEEDAGKNIHGTGGVSWVDLNRAGTPLLEIVSYPDMSSTAEARSYLTRLHTLIRYLGVSEANMDEGSFRADINISMRKKGDTKLGTKVELKNINSFKFISNAIEYEIERQITCLETGEKINQETRLWDNKQQKTFFMRSKEEAQDYRYFPEPDLPELQIDDAWLERIANMIPELPHDKFNRLQKEYGLSAYEADILVLEAAIANFFEAAAKISQLPKPACNWILRDLLAYLKEHKLEVSQTKLTPEALADLVIALDKGVINSKVAQEIFIEMMETGKTASVIIKAKGLEQIGSEEELEKIVLAVIEQNPDSVAKYRGGNERLFAFFVGQSMKETKGKGNPLVIQQLLKKHLG
jgi:aspartyl-tRNA(Asn)/glutamyl-tRNA(Gln) amidotransferase subunit B